MRSTLSLLDALSVPSPGTVSLAGGGGKTSLLWALASALVAEGKRVVTTTTTKIYPPTDAESPLLLLLEGEADPLAAVAAALARSPHVTVALDRAGGKLRGLGPEAVDRLARAKVADAVLVEADGAAGRPLKAARAGEPVFPAGSALCVAMMGIEALGKPLDDAWVFRAALAAEITGLAPGEAVTAEAAADLLLGARGIMRDAPASSRLVVFLNKVETDPERLSAHDLARLLLRRSRGRLSAVVLGSLRHPGAGFTVLDPLTDPER